MEAPFKVCPFSESKNSPSIDSAPQKIASFLLAESFEAFSQEKQNSTITKEGAKVIMTEFTKPEINYFYEVAFYNEPFYKKAQKLIKWNQDINIYIKGEKSGEDSANVSYAISEINKLDLPVYLGLVDTMVRGGTKP